MIQKYKSANTILEISLGLLAIASLAVSPIYNTFSYAIPIILILLISYFSSKYLAPNFVLYQYVGSASFAIFTALIIYQMHGMIEMHFIAFIGAILLINFKKWQLQLPLAVIVMAHYILFAHYQYVGNKEGYFTSGNNFDFQVFAIHLLLAATIFFLCGYWSYIFKITTDASIDKNQQLETQMIVVAKNIAIAKEISNGNLITEFEVKGNDELGQALLLMQQNLLVAQKRENEEKYFNIGLAQSAEIMRNNNANTDALSNNILTYLVKYLGANQGMMFVLNNENPLELYLELTACYAYDRKKFLDKKIEPGEGLIGTAFIEKDIIYLTDVPTDFVNITSGLGQAVPTSVLIVPLIINDEVFGVIELAFFNSLENYKIEFIKKLGENLASTISTVKTNERTKNLLQIAQEQSEQLRSQEEEMRQNMEEMTATQEEMLRKDMEMQSRIVMQN